MDAKIIPFPQTDRSVANDPVAEREAFFDEWEWTEMTSVVPQATTPSEPKSVY